MSIYRIPVYHPSFRGTSTVSRPLIQCYVFARSARQAKDKLRKKGLAWPYGCTAEEVATTLADSELYNSARFIA